MNKKIEFYCSDSQMMNDAIDRIVVKIHSVKKQIGAKSILLSGCSTESGTTTVAINLAIALSVAGWKTLLVDCDLRKGNTYKRVGEADEKGLAEFLCQEAKEEEVIYATNYEKLFYVPNGKAQKSPVRLFCSQKMENWMEQLKEEYDYIIYDMPSLNIVSDANILFPLIDNVILVAGIKKTTKRQIRDARRKVGEAQEKYLGMIINSVDIPQYKRYMKDFDYFGEKNLSKRHKDQMKKKSREKGKTR